MGLDRSKLLSQANEIISKDRAATHGRAEDSFATIAAYWTVYLEKEFANTPYAAIKITPLHVAAMMALFKVARLHNNPAHTDNWLDLIGYAALGGEIALTNKIESKTK